MVKPKPGVRSLTTPLRMFDGMDDEEAPKKQVEVLDGPVLSERDRAKLERRKRKEERQREVNFSFFLSSLGLNCLDHYLVLYCDVVCVLFMVCPFYILRIHAFFMSLLQSFH